MASPAGILQVVARPPHRQGTVQVPVRNPVVAGILVVHDGAAWLKECLDALALQTRPLDQLVIVDTGSTDDSVGIAGRHARIRQVVGHVEAISAPDQATFGEAVGRAVARIITEPAVESATEPVSPPAQGGPMWLWLLHDDSAAAPEALAHLLDAVLRSPSVGVAGPKLTMWDDPSRLLEVGLTVSRSGRRVGGPAIGEPDQGQHDHRSDVLGVNTSGMLIRLDVFQMLGGFDPAFGQFRDDLDLCWRAQLAGHRVVVAPRARMREAAASTNGRRSPGLLPQNARGRDRRHGRQVALARCSPWTAPFLAIWIALASLCSAAALLVAKRPHAAGEALGDFTSVLTPWRPMAARWRSRGVAQVRRRDLRGLFASPMAAFVLTADTIHEEASVGSARSFDHGSNSERALESGPACEDAESLERAPRGAGWRIMRHPGFLAVMAAVLLAVVTWRSLLGALVPGGLGVAGGELLPVSSNASELWHGWLDGWHGAGLGNGLESAPYLPVLSAGAWVLEHVPLIDASNSSVGVLISWLLAAAIPLSAWTAYLGARVVTRGRWPRAWAALAWASLATLTTAVAGGRLGAVVAHILLPLVAAGFVCAVRGSARLSAIFGAALALAVTAAFNPALGALGGLAALALLAVGRGRTRLRAAVLLLVPLGLLGPWFLQVVHHPLLLLSGPGLSVWQSFPTSPWHLELLHPGGPGSYPVLLSAPIVLAGVIAMSRRRGDPHAMTALAVLTITGLALGVASPHIIIGLIPADLPGAGAPITVWAGTGLDLAGLALIAAALGGFGVLSAELSLLHGGWRQVLFPVGVLTAVVGVAASMTMAARTGIGGSLAGQAANTPAVAQDQARPPWGNRLLALTMQGSTIGYRVVGVEPGPLVRDLPQAPLPPDPLLASAVKAAVGTGQLDPVNGARDDLADLGIGFVSLRGASNGPLATQLDATAGITRLSNSQGLILWRVLPRGSALGTSRLRLVDATGAYLASVPLTGDHGATEVALGSAALAAGRRLVVAEPEQWAAHVRVTYAGRRLDAIEGARQPTYLLPPTSGELNITLAPTRNWWNWARLGLLAVVLFLAAPFGASRRRGAL